MPEPHWNTVNRSVTVPLAEYKAAIAAATPVAPFMEYKPGPTVSIWAAPIDEPMVTEAIPGAAAPAGTRQSRPPRRNVLESASALVTPALSVIDTLTPPSVVG